jgi:hypothetical protein
MIKLQFCKTLLLFIIINSIIIFDLFLINIEKLFIKNLIITNKQDSIVNLNVSKNITCQSCSDYHKKKVSHIINPKNKVLINNNYSKICQLKVLDPKSRALIFENKNENFTFNLHICNHDNPKQDFPIFIKSFYDSVCNDKNYTDIISGNNSNYYARALNNNNISAKEFVTIIGSLYDNNINSNLYNNSNFSIPKTIHQIWFGKEIPQLYKKNRKNLKNKHSGWKFICWSEELINKLFKKKFLNQKLFIKKKNDLNYAGMSDVARYEILEKFGGVYIDCDFIFFESLESIHNKCDFYAVIDELSWWTVCANGFIGSKKNHPILDYCIKTIKKLENQNISLSHWPNESINLFGKKSIENLLEVGPGVFSNTIISNANLAGNINLIFPANYFLPKMTAFDRQGPFVSIEAFCYHDWYAQPKSQGYRWW